MNRLFRLQGVVFLSILFSCSALLCLPCFSQDKNGVSPNTISLPSGPGSIEGFGDAFQPMLNTGSSRYSVNIKVPEGTSSQTPEFSLQYDSGLGNGVAGIGWSADPGSISRQVDKGIPRYIDSANGIDDDHDGEVDERDELDTFLGTGGEELVEVSPSVYRARIEGTFVRYRHVGDSWLVDLKNGTTLEYGTTANARIADPQDSSHIYRWLLNKSTDVNGNSIEYSYAAIAPSQNKKYIDEIRYGPGSSPWDVYYFIKFSYESRPDWRKDYRSGFPVIIAHRLQKIDIGIQGTIPDKCAQGDWNHDSIPDALIGRYSLEYTQDYLEGSHLSRVVRFGSDGVNYLPPIRFAYSLPSPPETLSAAQHLIYTENTPSVVMDNALVELVDLNRDGLADILHTDFTGGAHFCSVNLGTEADDPFTVHWADQQQLDSDDGLALNLHLAEDQVNLADMDGDGLADLVLTSVADDVTYYRNTGRLAWGARRQMSIQDTAPPAPSASKDVITVDLDFDKRMDVVRSSEAGYTIWFNQKDGKYSRQVQSDGARYLGQVLLFSSPGVQTADMNGDRLLDVVRVRQNRIIVAANKGYGEFADAVSIPIPDVLLTDGENSQISRAKLTDINGDGLADLVVERAATNELWFWLNLGTDSLSERHIVRDMPSIPSSSTVVRWADMNGNGTADLVYADSIASRRLQILDIGELINGNTHPNMLSRIENGLGVSTDIFYKNSTEYYLQDQRDGNAWHTTVPFPVQVVSEVQTHTGLDLDDVPGKDVYRKVYSYRDGFYEDLEKQFRGFAEVSVVTYGDDSAPPNVSVTNFFTGGPDAIDNDNDNEVDEISPGFHREEEALKGMIRFLELKAEDGTVFNRSVNRWLVKNLLVTPSGEEVRLAVKEQVDDLIYEGDTIPEVLRTTFTYDNYGNITEENNEGAISISGDERYTSTEYINDSGLWMLGFPRRQTITDGNGVKAAETLSFYDGDSFVGLGTGQLTKGQLTRTQGWVGDTDYVDLVRSAYDAFGNITESLDGNGNRRSVEYDAQLHLFPVRETIEVGGTSPDLQLQASYNVGLGVLTASVDFNGHQSDYYYDVFARLTSLVKPGDTAYYPTDSFSYTMADPENGLQYEYDKDGLLTLTDSSGVASSVVHRRRELSGTAGTVDSIQYVDGMGRKLSQLSEGDTGFIVSGAVRFNTRGSVRYSYLPYTAMESGYVPPLQAVPALESRYDPTGRMVERISLPDTDGIVATEHIVFSPLSKTVVNANGISKDFTSDGLQQLIQMREHNLGQISLTTYQYDATGNLTRVDDPQNNIITMEYNGLGQKISMNDPDRGHMAYGYDPAGNLIRTTDNKGQVILYGYDGAGRQRSEDYLDSAGVTPDIEFHYDQASDEYPQALNLKGKLAWVRDLSGGKFFSYDSRGNPLWTVNRIVDGGNSRDYRSALEYDAMGRVRAAVYPDNDRIEYQYGTRGLLNGIPGIVDSISYTPSGSRSTIQYHNTISTSYAYDPRDRLQRLTTFFSASPSTPLQDISYTFDQLNNISEMVDHRSLPADSPANGSQDFAYDDLSRLVSAQGSGYGQIAFSYDPIGNMILKKSPDAPDLQHIADESINLGVIGYGGTAGSSNRSVRLPGAQPGPHAVTSTESGMAYGYDDNGNMTSHGTGDTYHWDFKDRLIQATTEGGTSAYVYDHSGSRVIKRVTENGETHTTYYVNDLFEVRDNRNIKFIFDGSERIGRIEGRLTSVGENFTQFIDCTEGWNFFSLELEPDTSAIAEVFASLGPAAIEIWEYNRQTGQYVGYAPAQGINDLTELHGRCAYLIKLTEPMTLTISGSRIESDISLDAGWNLIPSPTDDPLPISEALGSISGQYNAVWNYDKGNWQDYLPEQPAFLNNLTRINPAGAYWLDMKNSAQLQFTPQPVKIYYYHPDHLGSSGLISDENGNVVERTQYYPFGSPRYEERNGFDSAYKYTGKELDKDTGLMYYEARYYDPVVGRFVSVDPLAVYGEERDVQHISQYAYCNNNPLLFIDSGGMAPFRQLNLGPYVPDHFAKISKGYYSRTKGEILRDKIVKPLMAQRNRLRAMRPALLKASKITGNAGDIAKFDKVMKTIDGQLFSLQQNVMALDAADKAGKEVSFKVGMFYASGGASAATITWGAVASIWADAAVGSSIELADYYGKNDVKSVAEVAKAAMDVVGLFDSLTGTGENVGSFATSLRHGLKTAAGFVNNVLSAEGTVKSAVPVVKKAAAESKRRK